MSSRAILGIMRAVLAFSLFASVSVVRAEPLSSPTWGYSIDLPEGFTLVGGDGKSRFSFYQEDSGASVDLVSYQASRYDSPGAAAADAIKRIGAAVETSAFDYRGRRAIVARIEFDGPAGSSAGWLLAVELGKDPTTERRPILLALAYGPANSAAGNDGSADREALYLSALDSVAPETADRDASGPISAFAFPAAGRMLAQTTIGGEPVSFEVDRSDAEASKAIVDREFAVLRRYDRSPLWQEAWKRFYRAIRRDAFKRLAGLAFAVERAIAADSGGGGAAPNGADSAGGGAATGDRLLAEGVLGWVQGFKYERDLLGADFVDLVSAAVETRGDCDSRALLFVVVLQHANIESILMVSREYAHAMAAARVDGAGARFPYGETQWVVAETTAKVPLGLIGKNVSDSAKWLGIDF